MTNFKKLLPLLIAGILIRVLIASMTFHPDLKIMNFTSAIFLREFDLNPYDFYGNLAESDPNKQIYRTEQPDDLPFQYWIHLPIDLLTRPLVNNRVEDQFLMDTSRLLGTNDLWAHLFIIKLPLLLFDLLVAILLLYLVPINRRKNALLLWLFNPVTLWSTAAIGQVDIMPTCFMVLALLLVKQGKRDLGALSLGVGAAIKSFPLLILPFLVFLEDRWSQRIKLMLLGLLPLIVSVLPYLGSIGFRDNALFAPQLEKMLFGRILLSGSEALILSVVALVGLYAFYQSKRRNYQGFFLYSFAALLVTLSLTHFHPQWFLWILPFLIVLHLSGQLRRVYLPITGIFLSWLGMLSLFDASLLLRLLSPLIPGLQFVSGLAENLSPDKLMFYRSLTASIFAGNSLLLITKLLTQSRD